MGPQGPRDRRSQTTEPKQDEDVAGLQSKASVESAKKKAVRKKSTAKKKAVRKKSTAKKKAVTRKKTAKNR